MAKKKEKPRWWTQNYILFLALRRAKRPLCRKELIPLALKLDKELSRELGLPSLFHGKTPQNTASGRLTTNNENYFVSFKPEDSKVFYFKLAYEPGCFKSAYEKYTIWTRNLIELDWPILFQSVADAPAVVAESDDKVLPVEESAAGELLLPVPLPAGAEYGSTDGLLDYGSAESTEFRGLVDENLLDMPNWMNIISTGATEKDFKIAKEFQKISQSSDLSGKLSTKINPQISKPIPAVKLKEYHLPKSYDELLEKKLSTIPNANFGLFAKQDIPKHTFLGFYFGVPMTEDEFDSLKARTGKAEEYCFRYRNTVLDATDENGELYDIDCPFFFINEDRSKPNVVFIEGAEVNQVICMTVREIVKGEELFVDYGNDVQRNWIVNKEPNPCSLCWIILVQKRPLLIRGSTSP